MFKFLTSAANDATKGLQEELNLGLMGKMGQSESGGTHIEISIKPMKRKTMALHVLENGVVEVRVPKRCPKYLIKEFVTKNQNWIMKKVHEAKVKFEDLQGQTYFFGEQFELIKVVGKKTTQILSKQILLQNPDFEKPIAEDLVQLQLQEWKRSQAKEYFPKRIEFWFPKLIEAVPGSIAEKLQMPEVFVRKMKTRWGSCSSKGHVNLALNLIDQPKDFIDQVIVHELCHLVEFNHSSRFYSLMDQIMPNWRATKSIS